MSEDRKRWKLFQDIPLRAILTMPFVAIMVITVGLVGYFSYRNGQDAVNNVAHGLRSRIISQIHQHLDSFLGTPLQLNLDNSSLFRQGLLKADDPAALQIRFLELVKQNPSINSIYFGNMEGGIIGSGREGPNGGYYTYTTDHFEAGTFRKYSIDSDGNRLKEIQTIPNFDARKRSWFTGSVEKKTATWNDVYVLITGQDMALAASHPVYDENNQLIGVISVDIFLSQIDQFLKNMEISPSGQSFIIERSGMLVASSVGKFTGIGLKADRIQAIDSNIPLISTTADYLIKKYQYYRNIPSSEQQLSFDFQGAQYFLQILPLQDLYGIDWLILVAIPEADFMAPIDVTRQVALEMILVALFAANIISILVANIISKQILILNQSTRALALGNWDNSSAPPSAIREIEALGNSFNVMRLRLRQTLNDLMGEITERKLMESSMRESEIRMIRLLGEEQRHSEELTALNEIGRAVISNLDFDQVLRTLYEQCKRVLPVDVFYVAVFDESTGMIQHPLVVEKDEFTSIAPRNIKEHPGLSGKVLMSRKTIYLPDTLYPDEDWAALIISTNDEPIRAYIGVPMIVRGRAIGVISIQSYQENAFTQEQIHLLEIIGDQVAAAVVNARLFEQVQYNARFLSLLHETTNAALQEANLNNMIQTLATRMGELFQADGCFITRWDEAQQQAIPTAAFKSLTEVYRTIDSGPGEITLTQSVLKTGKPLVVEDIQNCPYISKRLAKLFPMSSILALPLTTGTQKLGAVMIGFRGEHIFTNDEIALGELAAGQMALAIAKTELVTTDELTQLYNRRGLFELGQREVERSRELATCLSAVLFDIDNFKLVNDRHGHAIGDQVLTVIAERCQRAVRSADTFARYGGEEFIVLLPETSLSVASQVAERICRCIAEEPIDTQAGPIKVTVSAGVACMSESASELDILIDQADNAMYAAKQNGRNRVMIFQS